MKLEIIIPTRLWEKMDTLEKETGIRKEDILMRAVINIIEGIRCPKCGSIIKEFG
jgi:hypothetical protein